MQEFVPIATRLLTLTDGDARRKVLVRIWAPIALEERYACDVAVDGLDEPIRESIVGMDALQALTIALAAIRSSLDPYGDRISWFDDGPSSRGWHGIPYQVSLPTPEHERRVIERIQSEIDRESQEQHAPYERREMDLRDRHDPGAEAVGWDEMGSAALLDALRAARERERELLAAGSGDAASVFSSKQWYLVYLLRKRSDYRESLETLCRDPDQRLCFIAADHLKPEPPARATFERLRDEGTGWESETAGRIVEVMAWNALETGRIRPWDLQTEMAEVDTDAAAR